MQLTLPSITEVAKTGTFGLKLPALPDNPFVGLRPFNSDEALLYFGRREQTIELLQQLHRTHFVALVGSSGCGKSSLVRAGLIPKLKAGFLVEERDQWLIATMKPGDAPLDNLADALLRATTGASNETEREALVAAIRAEGAEAVVERLTPALTDSDANLLLLIDQFEELFRFGLESGKAENRTEVTKFVDLMLALSEQRQLPIYVVMTMRSDFLGDCDNFRGLPEAMNRSQYLVPRLTREQVRQAVEGPVNLFGAAVAPQLVNRVLDDIGFQSDQLPVMQHALMRTWERWQESRDPQIEVGHYEAVGGIRDALSRDAEDALKGLTDDDQKIAERVFQALTDTDAGNRRIRRPAHLSEIAAITGASRETILEIIERFRSRGRSFLTVTGVDDPLIDISHESLIRQWERMSQWVTQEAGWRDLYLRLSHDAGIFERRQDSKNLLKGSHLESALEWREQREPNPSWASRYHPDFEPDESRRLFHRALDFLEKSRRAVEEEEIASKRRIRNRRIATALLTLLGFGLAAIFGVLALKLATQKTQLQQAGAESERLRGLEASARVEADRQKNLALEEKAKADAERDKAEKNYQEAERQRLLADLAQQKSEEGRRQISQLLYDADLNLVQNAAESGNRDKVYELLKTYAPPSNSADLREFFWFYLWKSNIPEIGTLKIHESIVISVAFSPDGKMLASASGYPSSRDPTVKLWDVASRQNVATLKGHESSVLSVAFSPDGKTLASGSRDRTVKLWDVATRQNEATLKGHGGDVISVAFSPDGKTLASGSEDRTVKLWDVATRQNVATLRGHEAYVRSVAFSPDGKTLASGSRDRTVKLWDVSSRQQLATLKGHEAAVWSVAFSPDGKTLASGSSDNSVKLWDVSSGQNVATLKGHEAAVSSVAFSPDGKTLASAGGDIRGKKDFAIRLWFAATDEEVARQRNR